MTLVDGDLIADLEARGLIHDSTDREHLREQVAAGSGQSESVCRRVSLFWLHAARCRLLAAEALASAP